MATFYSVDAADAGKDSNRRLSPRSPADEVAKRAALEQVLERFGEVDTANLSPRERVFHDALETTLRGALAPAAVVDYGTIFSAWGMWYMPYAVNHMGGPQDQITKLLDTQQPVRNAADAEDYLARLAAYPKAIDETIAKIEHDRGLGVVPPGFVIDKTILTLAAPTGDDASKHPLAVVFEAKARAAGLPNPEALARRAAELVATRRAACKCAAGGQAAVVARGRERRAGHLAPAQGRRPVPGDDHPHDRHPDVAAADPRPGAG